MTARKATAKTTTPATTKAPAQATPTEQVAKRAAFVDSLRGKSGAPKAPAKRSTRAKATPATTPAKAAAKAPARATTKAAAPKAPAKAAPAAATAPATAKASTDTKVLPTDPAELRHLIKITSTRRYKAAARGDDALATEMETRSAKLRAALAKAVNKAK